MSAGGGAAMGGIIGTAAVTGVASLIEGSAVTTAVVAGGPATWAAAGVIAAGTAIGAGVGKLIRNNREENQRHERRIRKEIKSLEDKIYKADRKVKEKERELWVEKNARMVVEEDNRKLQDDIERQIQEMNSEIGKLRIWSLLLFE